MGLVSGGPGGGSKMAKYKEVKTSGVCPVAKLGPGSTIGEKGGSIKGDDTSDVFATL